MNLDMRTMVTMLGVFSFLFSILLLLADTQSRGIRGLRIWALANLLISLGFCQALILHQPDNGWGIAAGAVLLAAGEGLYLIGIRTFLGKPQPWWLLLLAVAATAGQSIWLGVVDWNPNLRAILNSVVFAGLDIACAGALFADACRPERIVYRLTGASFALMAVVHLLRAAQIATLPEESYRLYAQIPVNPMAFFAGSICHLFITFGFILLVNHRLSAELDLLAATDPLTGIWNRRSLEAEFKRLQSYCLRKGEPLSVIMLDIDHFKSINDRYGHPAGDAVLRHLAEKAKSEIRCNDYLARYGGEEFCLIVPGTGSEATLNLAERLRLSYAQKPVIWREHAIYTSISLGVACSHDLGGIGPLLLDAADAALYTAKQTGRNRAVRHDSQAAAYPAMALLGASSD